MNIKINREKILPTLSLINNVIEKRQTLPILANLLLNLTDGDLTITGTDFEVEITEKIRKVEGDNQSFTISSQNLLSIVRMLPENADITISFVKDSAIIESGKVRYKLKTLPHEQFPRIDTMNWEERFEVDKSELKHLLKKTAFSMAVQDPRYYLNGVLIKLEGTQMRAIATNGHRLAQTDIDIGIKLSSDRELIIPRKAVQEIIRFIDRDNGTNDDPENDGDTKITFEINQNHVRLSCAESFFITKLIDGKFPEFNNILTKEYDSVIQVDRSNFLKTLNRVAILTLTSDQHKGVKMNLQDSILRLSVSAPTGEEATEEMEVDYQGEALEIGYNVSYLIDVAQNGQSETLDLHIPHDGEGCIIKEHGNDSTVWLIMPLRL